MRFHLFGLAHFPTTNELARCPFTALTFRMAAMLNALGHEIVFYGAAGSYAPCNEFVELVSEDLLRYHTSGIADKKHWHPSRVTDAVWQEFREKGAVELRRRYRDGDLALMSFGNYQDFVPPIARISCEFICGYSGIFGGHAHVFPSNAWMHYLYGELKMVGKPAWHDAVIPHYLDTAQFRVRNSAEKAGYLLYVGRVEHSKGVDIAVDVAEAAGRRLLVAGHSPAGADPIPHLDKPHVQYLGGVDRNQRDELFRGAVATIMPTRYLESFGMVAIESMACGTPVIATDWGAFPETIDHGRTGFRCRTFADFVSAVDQCESLSPEVCRRWVEERYCMSVIGPRYERYFRMLTEVWSAGGQEWYTASPFMVEQVAS